MKESIKTKLQGLLERYEEISVLLGNAEVIQAQQKFRALSKEYAQLAPIVTTFKLYTAAQQEIKHATELLNESDPEIQALAKEELASAERRRQKLTHEFEILLLPKDPNDQANVFLEIRAGTGGDEAAIFSGDLFRMYSRYAEAKGWQIVLLNCNEGEHGGYKEIITKVSGECVYSQLKFESGAHRVQRVPTTESQGRVHTSACTVAVMPEADEIQGIEINSADLKVDTFRASGAGGQHVNKTDSAIRITHLPTGVVVECQDERSQHKNRAQAMSILKSKLLQAEIDAQQQATANERKTLVGSGDRSERIRTYNFPQGRVTDHRINLTLYKLEDIIAGDLDAIIQPLIQEHQTDLLAQLSSGND